MGKGKGPWDNFGKLRKNLVGGHENRTTRDQKEKRKVGRRGTGGGRTRETGNGFSKQFLKRDDEDVVNASFVIEQYLTKKKKKIIQKLV